jgi:hypothetical protein
VYFTLPHRFQVDSIYSTWTFIDSTWILWIPGGVQVESRWNTTKISL